MNEHDLLRLIGQVDESLVEQAADWKPRRRVQPWKAWLAACACAALAVALAAPGLLQLRGCGSAGPSMDMDTAAAGDVAESSAPASGADTDGTDWDTGTFESADVAESDEEAITLDGLSLLGVGVGTAEQQVQALLGAPVSRTEPVADGDALRFTARYQPVDGADVELEFTDSGDGYRVTRLVLDELSGTLTLDNGLRLGMDRASLETVLAALDGLDVREDGDTVEISVPDYGLRATVTLRDDAICRIELAAA